MKYSFRTLKSVLGLSLTSQTKVAHGANRDSLTVSQYELVLTLRDVLNHVQEPDEVVVDAVELRRPGVRSIAGAVVLTRMPELRSLDVLADGPSGVAFLEIHGLGVRACETLALEARLGLVPGAVNRDGERCSAEFDDSNPEVVATRANFDLTWTLEGVPESFTQHLEWGPEDDFDNAELVSVTSDARGASFVAPPVDTNLRFELEVVWSGGARTAVWHLRSDEGLASLPPTISGPRNLIVAAGFDPHFDLVAMDPDGPSPGPVTVIDAPMGNVQRVSETGWVYEAPRGFRGLDTARFEVVSGDRSATQTLTFDVRDAAGIVSDVDGPGVELFRRRDVRRVHSRQRGRPAQHHARHGGRRR